MGVRERDITSLFNAVNIGHVSREFVFQCVFWRILLIVAFRMEIYLLENSKPL